MTGGGGQSWPKKRYVIFERLQGGRVLNFNQFKVRLAAKLTPEYYCEIV